MQNASPRTCCGFDAARHRLLKIAEARKILGAPSDTATIEMALDLVGFRQELVAGTRAMRGTRIERFDEQ